MIPNVPRLGAAGGWIHMDTRSFDCSPDDIVDWREVAKEAVTYIQRMNIECGILHHEPQEYHNSSEECPVFRKIEIFLNKYDNLISE